MTYQSCQLRSHPQKNVNSLQTGTPLVSNQYQALSQMIAGGPKSQKLYVCENISQQTNVLFKSLTTTCSSWALFLVM
jgi:hypothetical protein